MLPENVNCVAQRYVFTFRQSYFTLVSTELKIVNEMLWSNKSHNLDGNCQNQN